MELFDKAYNQEAYLDFLAGKFTFSKSLLPINIDNNEVKSFKRLGAVETKDDKTLSVFEIYVKPNTQLQRNRVRLRNLVAKEIQTTEDGALAVYVDEENNQWRFSFIAIEWKLTDEGFKEEQTASKRFTYLLGENTQTRTVGDRFATIDEQPTLEDLRQAFAVEPLNKEFYDKLYRWYEKTQKQVVFPNDEQAENHAQTSLIRLLTRLLFIWFIKEKKLINADLFDKDKLQKLIHYDQSSSFYKAILQNLFFATLNRPITERSFRTTTNETANKNNYLVTNIYRYQSYFTNSSKDNIIALFEQTPFLNGGLFECLDREASDEEQQNHDRDRTIRPARSAIRVDGFSDRADNQLKFPNELFFRDDEQNYGLINLFKQYQFTVEESTPLDIEVALDPELLGKVFENLLASYNPETGQQARKATGSFYTPREIVSYMVDESLKQYFKQNTGLDESEINDLFIEKESRLDDERIKTIIHAIDNLKILDPAVGSGAYPMGILQRLVFILEKVDPKNIHFKQQQINKAEQIQDEASRDSAIAAIEQVFSRQNQHNAYGKKLYLIENAIYGVDIQSVAIQICKLRFFISLTIEQSPNWDKNEDYNIKALPNLETKFIVANSLLPLGEMPKDAGLFDEKIKELQKELAEVRHRHFSARTLTTKRKYRKEDKTLREQMRDELTTESGITPEIEQSMQKIVNWDLYNQNTIADWFNPEWQFGVKNSFDIVIGNPPYIQLQKDGGRLGNLYQNRDFKTFARSGDIYQLFYERGMELLTDAQGILAFITSNSWMRARYGKKLRGFLSTKHIPLRLIDMGQDAFEAIVDTNILLVSTGRAEQEFKAVDMDSLAEKQFPPAERHWSEIRPAGDMAWSILPPVEEKIKSRIEQLGTPLKDWDIRIYRGVLTGLNEAFIIDTAKRDELVAADPKSAEIIKPILRGRDVGRYGYKWAGKWLINSHNGDKNNAPINIDDYPAIKNHLNQYYPYLEKRQDKGITPYNLRNCAYLAEFEKEKLIWIELVDKGRFAYDDKAIYCEATTFIMTGSSTKYLSAILNSSLAHWYLSQVAPTSGMGTLRWKKIYIETIPLPLLDKARQQPFMDIVDQILTAKQDNTDTTALEAEIDKRVYQLYNLTADEIKIIEAKK